LPQAGQLWLLSPGLDVAMRNPDAGTLEAVEVVLSSAGLVLAGQHSLGALPADHAWASPLYGELQGVAPMAIWVGTNELFLPDVRQLRARVAPTGGVVHYTEAEGMFHAYPVFPVPEAAQVLQQMCGLLMRRDAQ